ncbi:hypothetical protein FRC11_007451 [Ceratobasidium sp. 423]|nr:hypothetical protein FRC11_007451 [Ceratobasidium sp. 423]
MSDHRIRRAISNKHLYEFRLINHVQLGLYMGIIAIPPASYLPLQREVYDFFNGPIMNTNYPLAKWSTVMHGIRWGAHGVYNPYDLIGFKSLEKLKNMHTTMERNSGHEYMLSTTHSIFIQPGRYTTLVKQFYTNAGPTENDALGVTFLQGNRLFNTQDYLKLNLEAVVHYLWVVLKIPRNVALYSIEPFVRLSAIVDCAVKLLLELNSPGMLDYVPPLSSCSPMTDPEAVNGRGFMVSQPLSFECGPCHLEEQTTGAVDWLIPPPDIRDVITTLELNFDWVPDRLCQRFDWHFGERLESARIVGWL